MKYTGSWSTIETSQNTALFMDGGCTFFNWFTLLLHEIKLNKLTWYLSDFYVYRNTDLGERIRKEMYRSLPLLVIFLI